MNDLYNSPKDTFSSSSINTPKSWSTIYMERTLNLTLNIYWPQEAEKHTAMTSFNKTEYLFLSITNKTKSYLSINNYIYNLK